MGLASLSVLVLGALGPSKQCDLLGITLKTCDRVGVNFVKSEKRADREPQKRLHRWQKTNMRLSAASQRSQRTFERNREKLYFNVLQGDHIVP
jgi:hypothetical protein